LGINKLGNNSLLIRDVLVTLFDMKYQIINIKYQYQQKEYYKHVLVNIFIGNNIPKPNALEYLGQLQDILLEKYNQCYSEYIGKLAKCNAWYDIHSLYLNSKNNLEKFTCEISKSINFFCDNYNIKINIKNIDIKLLFELVSLSIKQENQIKHEIISGMICMFHYIIMILNVYLIIINLLY